MRGNSKAVVGIKTRDELRSRMLSIARDECKPKPSEPNIWLTSMRSLAEVLSYENHALLKLISENHPDPITSLAELTGRRTSNLSRTLKTTANYGLIEMQREKNLVRLAAKATEFRIVANLDFAIAVGISVVIVLINNLYSSL